MPDVNTIQELRDGLSNLGERDQIFASSLIAQYINKGRLSVAQWEWVGRLAERANAPPPERHKVDIGTMSGIIALFDKAAEHLKSPAIVIAVIATGDPMGPYAQKTIRLNVAQAHHRVPGSINVKDGDLWLGRILRNGILELSPKVPPEDVADVSALLRRFSADPAGVATEYGRLTGRCTFCRLPLCDERSTAVGYGKTCADNWGLPWGTAKHTFVQAPAQPTRRKSRRNIKVEGT